MLVKLFVGLFAVWAVALVGAYARVERVMDQAASPVAPIDPTVYGVVAASVISAIGVLVLAVMDRMEKRRVREQAAMERREDLERADRAEKKADEAAQKQDGLIKTAERTEAQSNSMHHNLEKALELMREKFAGSERHVAQLEEEKRTTATMRTRTDLQAAEALRAPAPGAPAAESAPAESLENIDQNTAKIERNTARTDATVAQLKKEGDTV